MCAKFYPNWSTVIKSIELFQTFDPTVCEMDFCRDAVDVNYQRMAITGEELSGVVSWKS